MSMINIKVIQWKTWTIKKKSIQINFELDLSFSAYSLIQYNHVSLIPETILRKITYILFLNNNFLFLMSG